MSLDAALSFESRGNRADRRKNAAPRRTVPAHGRHPLPIEPEAPSAERLRNREASAFEALLARHRGQVARLARRLLAWNAEVEEVVQEVFTRAWENAPRYRGDGDPGAWLTGITVRVCRGRLRSPWRRRRVNGVELDELEPVRMPLAAKQDDGPAPQDVRRALAHLSPKLREVVVLHYLEEEPIERVATLLGLSRRAVDTRLSRARGRLRETLGSTGGEG